MKGITYKEIMWDIPWGVVLRMLADLPYHKALDEEDKKDSQKLTPETADKFKAYIDKLNSKNKSK